MSFEQNDKVKKRVLNMKKEILQHKLQDRLAVSFAKRNSAFASGHTTEKGYKYQPQFDKAKLYASMTDLKYEDLFSN